MLYLKVSSKHIKYIEHNKNLLKVCKIFPDNSRSGVYSV